VTLAYLAHKLAAVVSFAMAEPGRLMGQTASNADLDDLDADGDYEMDDEYEQEPALDTQTPQADGRSTDAEGSDVDAEGEEVDDDEDEAEPVGAVKIALRRTALSDEEEDYDDDEEEAAVNLSDAKTSDSEDESSAESEEEAPWQAESDNGEEAEVAKSDPNVCM
jgi:histone acetyltransferase SAS3